MFHSRQSLTDPIGMASIDVHGGGFYVFASSNIYAHLSTLHYHRLHLTLTAAGTSFMCHDKLHKAVSMCVDLKLQMSVALRAKNLGQCAESLQERHTFVPYSTHKGLREVPRLNFAHVWRVSVAPPNFLIYAIYYLHLGILYVGLTHIASVQCLRKHIIDALAGVDGACLHQHTLTVDMAVWVLLSWSMWTHCGGRGLEGEPGGTNWAYGLSMT